MLDIRHLYKAFGHKRALDGVSLKVATGEIVALLGPSGCGKSTLLGLVAGLDTPDAGAVFWDGQNLEKTPTHRRQFGLMFQDYALFPHLSVQDNVGFGLQMAGWAPQARLERAAEMLALVDLQGFETRSVTNLSGGEQQRVALARALAPRPRLLMLDEPLGALDRTLRERLVGDLRRILRQLGQTTLYVTHDQEEAFTIADRVALLNAGQLVQSGSPAELYAAPVSPFAARFMGLTNLFPGTPQERKTGWFVQTEIGAFPLASPPPAAASQSTVLLRPDAVSLDSQNEQAELRGRLREVTFRGSLSRLMVTCGSLELAFDLPSTTTLPDPGSPISLYFSPTQALQVFWEAG